MTCAHYMCSVFASHFRSVLRGTCLRAPSLMACAHCTCCPLVLCQPVACWLHAQTVCTWVVRVRHGRSVLTESFGGGLMGVGSRTCCGNGSVGSRTVGVMGVGCLDGGTVHSAGVADGWGRGMAAMLRRSDLAGIADCWDCGCSFRVGRHSPGRIAVNNADARVTTLCNYALWKALLTVNEGSVYAA